MSEPVRLTEDQTCLDVKFYIDSQFYFQVPSLKNNFCSYREMKEAIELRGKVKEAQSRKKLSIPIVSSGKGNLTIAGVHAGTGDVILTPKTTKSDAGALYPRVAWIEAALAEKELLNDEIRRLRAILEQFEIAVKSGYSRFSPDQHPAEIDRVEKEYDARKAAAEATSLKEMRAKTPVPRKSRF